MAQVATVGNSTIASSRTGDLVRDGLLVGTAILMAATLYLVSFYVPTEANLGVSQRIFYFHVPVAILSLVSILVVAVASAVHLITKGSKSDAVAYASAEVGIVFCTIAIATGAIWGKPVWGQWWTWDPKLTLTLVLWFIYASYLMLRAYGPKGSQGARYGAVLALIGAVDSPIIYYAAELWRSTHPTLLLGPAAESDALDPKMAVAILVALATFIILFVHLIIERYSLRNAETDVDEIFQQVS
jgi:heme exporter protein C